ncbi:MAG: NAD(P)/FAD-dependent oxidoreductase [Gammaproteobacteria bacterium]
MGEKSGTIHRIIIVGGGAAGLELASRLGKKLGKSGKADITLIDAAYTHIWKPLLHEIAAGTMDEAEEIEFLAQAHRCHFRFRLGRMEGLNRERKEIYLSPVLGGKGEEIIPKRTLQYDTLVISVGSVSNSFGVPGVEEHCMFLDTTQQAYRFQKRLVENHVRHYAGATADGSFSIAIVGAGATGVELSAELHEVASQLAIYGYDNAKVEITIIEAADQLLPALPRKLALATQRQLTNLGIVLKLGRRVVEVTQEGVKTHDGEMIAADVKVWAAGIKGPDWLKNLDGLETNRINQLVVDQTLQTTRDKDIFAMGDCSACPWPGHDQNVPPRAQAAHQQATTLSKTLVSRLHGGPAVSYVYRDYGSLVSLGSYTTIGNLMGNLMGSVSVGGFIARLVYLSLYKLHQIAIHGYFRTAMLTLANLFRRTAHARIKLH